MIIWKNLIYDVSIFVGGTFNTATFQMPFLFLNLFSKSTVMKDLQASQK